MKLSVIIPVWNTGENACELIRKLLGQYDGMEIIAVDDGSTDDSLALLKKLAKEDSRVRVIHQENAGQSAARNAGINISRGEYLCFLDSDDDVADNYILEMMSAIEKRGDILLAVCGMKYHRLANDEYNDVYIRPLRRRRNGEKMADYIITLLACDGRMYSSVNKIFRADIVRENGINFELNRTFAEDTNFVLDYIAAGVGTKKYSSGDIIFILKPLYIYNYGTQTSTVRDSATYWENWERSYGDLKNWAKELGGGKIGVKTWALLKLVRLRWRISYRRSIKRAKTQGAMRKQDKAGAHAWKYIGVGVGVTLFDFVVCTVLTRFVFQNNDMLEVASIIATFVATFVAYFLHSRITWKDRDPGRSGIIKFFLWNMLAAFAIKPLSTWFFGLFTGLYQWTHGITSFMGLPFDYDTIEYLGVYTLATIVLMTLNFFFYDKLVFGNDKD